MLVTEFSHFICSRRTSSSGKAVYIYRVGFIHKHDPPVKLFPVIPVGQQCIADMPRKKFTGGAYVKNLRRFICFNGFLKLVRLEGIIILCIAGEQDGHEKEKEMIT